jgi:hypothetical protein
MEIAFLIAGLILLACALIMLWYVEHSWKELKKLNSLMEKTNIGIDRTNELLEQMGPQTSPTVCAPSPIGTAKERDQAESEELRGRLDELRDRLDRPTPPPVRRRPPKG